MNFDQNEEQQLLAESVRRFVDKAYSFEQRRAIIASEDGYSHDVWKTLADLGLLGLPFSTEHGGFGGGAVDAMPVMEIIGDVLMVEPYLATVGWTGQLIARGGSPRQQAQWLPLLADGKLKLAFAQVERGARYDLARVAVRANLQPMAIASTAKSARWCTRRKPTNSSSPRARRARRPIRVASAFSSSTRTLRA